jgi:hypothetical protein
MRVKAAPAFWGRQVEKRVPSWWNRATSHIERDATVRQDFHPSRVLVARKHAD